MPLTLAEVQQKRQDLALEPYTFLRRNVFNATHMGAPEASAMMHVHFFESRDPQGTRPGYYLRLHSRADHVADNLIVQCRDPNFIAGNLLADDNPLYKPPVILNAHWIATTPYPAPADPDNPPPFPWYPLPTDDGPIYMFTQRLTGCSFLYRMGAEGVEVAHIIPIAPETGADLEARLHALFVGQNVTIYGRSRYNLEREATIVGIRNAANRWRFYAQKRDLNSRNVRSINQI